MKNKINKNSKIIKINVYKIYSKAKIKEKFARLHAKKINKGKINKKKRENKTENKIFFAIFKILNSI